MFWQSCLEDFLFHPHSCQLIKLLPECLGFLTLSFILRRILWSTDSSGQLGLLVCYTDTVFFSTIQMHCIFVYFKRSLSWFIFKLSLSPGVLACLDGYMNIALEQTEEYVNGQLKNKYGDAFIRGNNGNSSSLCYSLWEDYVWYLFLNLLSGWGVSKLPVRTLASGFLRNLNVFTFYSTSFQHLCVSSFLWPFLPLNLKFIYRSLLSSILP